MKIGIIGSGDVARALGEGLAAVGHSVMLGTRDTGKKELKAWKNKKQKRSLYYSRQNIFFSSSKSKLHL